MIETQKGTPMASKSDRWPWAAARCVVCSGAMVLTLVEADPTNAALERGAYACADSGHSQTYCVDAGDS
jgi:hypothetical protein